MDPQLKYLMVTLTPEGRIDSAYFSISALLSGVIEAIKNGNAFEVYELDDECYSYSVGNQ